MKKILLSICAVLTLGLVSCGGGESGSSETYYYDDYNSEGSNINFKGGHVHIDEDMPWNVCDICGKHVVRY